MFIQYRRNTTYPSLSVLLALLVEFLFGFSFHNLVVLYHDFVISFDYLWARVHFIFAHVNKNNNQTFCFVWFNIELNWRNKYSYFLGSHSTEWGVAWKAKYSCVRDVLRKISKTEGGNRCCVFLRAGWLRESKWWWELILRNWKLRTGWSITGQYNTTTLPHSNAVTNKILVFCWCVCFYWRLINSE